MTGILEIGDYSIVEHYPWKTEGSRVLTGDPDMTHKEYSCYVNGESCSETAESLDRALVACIAYKCEGANHHADEYFMKMIGKG